MLGYAARSVPWGRVVLAACLVVVLLELVRRDPWVLWPLQGTAVGLLAGAAAWCFDESSAVVVDVAPRSLAWRTTARAAGLVVLLAAWSAVVVHAGDETLFGHRDAIWLQGVAAVAAGASYASWGRAQGEATPGLVFAGLVVPATTVWALVRPLGERLPVFPYGTETEAGWRASTSGWLALALVAALVLAAAMADAPWWRARDRVGRLAAAGR